MNIVGGVGPIESLPVLLADLFRALVHVLGAGIARGSLLGSTFGFNPAISCQPAEYFLGFTLCVSHTSYLPSRTTNPARTRQSTAALRRIGISVVTR